MELQIFTDGGSRGNPGPAAIGVVMLDQGKQVVYEVGKTIGIGTNNEAEYQAFIHSLEWLASFKSLSDVTRITWKLDSKLVVEQLNKHWKIKEPRMLSYAQSCWKQLSTLPCSYSINHIPREENAAADALVNQALDAAQ